MNDLSQLIASEHLFQVEIQAESLQTLFTAFFKKMKYQDSRIEKLEQQLKNCIQKAEYDDHQSEIRARITENESDIENIRNEFDQLSKNMVELEERLSNKIEERANDIMMTSTSSNEQAYSNIQSNFDLLQKSVQEFMAKQPKDNMGEIMQRVDAKFADLETKVKEMSEKNAINTDDFATQAYVDRAVNDAASSIQNSLDRQFENYNNNIYNILEDESGGANDRSIAAKLRIALAHLRSEFEAFKNGFANKPSPFMSSARTNGDTESTDSGNEYEIYQKNVARAMMALNNTVNTLIAEGAGLGKLPFLQLSQNAPALFLDDFKAVEPDRVGDKKIPKHSGGGGAVQRKMTEKVIVEEAKKKTGLTPEDIQTISLRIASELKIEDFLARMNEIEKQNVDVLSALDRKVDREFDERLFEKFRVYINQLKESVNNLSAQSEVYATREEVEEVKKIATGIPMKVIDQCSVARKGPVCLFCGRPKTSVAGSISPRTARKIGRAPVAVPAVAATDLVYGEGQAFVKAGDTGSIQRFDLVMSSKSPQE